MSIVDGSKVNAAVTNSKLVSKTATTGNEVTGIISMNNTTDGSSGSSISNVQAKINDNADRISTNETDISTNASDITALEALNPSTRLQLAGTLTPPGALSDGTGTEGEIYRVDSDGDVTFDGGTTEHFVKENDWVYYDGSNWRVVNFQNFVSFENSISTGSLNLSADGGNFVVATNSSLTSLIGIEASMKGAPVLFCNKTGNDISVLHQDSGAPAGQKLDLIDDTDITLKDSGCLLFAYDDINDAWVLVGGSGAGGGGTADPNQIITGENRDFNNGLGDWISKKPKALSVSSIDTGADSITFSENHGLAINSKVTYSDGGGTAIGGLTDSTDYYVIEVPSKTSVKVSASEGGSVVDISGASTDGDFTLSGVGLGSGDGLDDATGSSDFEIIHHTSTPIYGAGSGFLIKYSGSSNENYIVTLPNQSVPYGLRGEPLKLSVALKDNTLSADFIDVWIGENETNTVRKLYNANDGSLDTSETPGYQGIYYPSSGVETVNIFFRINTSDTGAFATKIDNIRLFWEPLVSLPANEGWKDVTSEVNPSAGFGTVTNKKVFSKVTTDGVRFRGSFNAGTVAASSGHIELPSKYTIDTTKLNSATNLQAVGDVERLHGGGSSVILVDELAPSSFKAFYDGSATDKIFITRSHISSSFQKLNVNNMFGSGEGVSFDFEVPIKELSGNTTEAISLSSGLQFDSVYHASGFSIATTTETDIVYDTALQGSNYDTSTGIWTAPKSSTYIFNSQVNPTAPDGEFFDIRIEDITNTRVLAKGRVVSARSASPTQHVAATSKPVKLNQGDQVKVKVTQESGTSRSYGSGEENSFFTALEYPFSQTALLGLNQTAFLKDVKASGTEGGSSVSGEQTRDLNDLSGETSFVSLSGNVFTLQPGKYKIRGRAPGHRISRHKVYILDSSLATVYLTGSCTFSDNTTTDSVISGEIEITSQTSFVLRQYAQLAVGTIGLGVATNITGRDEVYAELEITKVR